jgi:hypothetical protein
MTVTGGCLCKAVRYWIDDEPIVTRECPALGVHRSGYTAGAGPAAAGGLKATSVPAPRAAGLP